MSRKLFVTKLPFKTTDTDLAALFSPYGEVKSAKVILDKETGRSRGFGFVEFGFDDEGMRACQALDGRPVDNMTIVVKVAEDRRR